MKSNKNKSLFESFNGWYHLLFLLMCVFGGLCLSIVLITICNTVSGAGVNSVNYMRLVQAISSVGIFMLPSLLYVRSFCGGTKLFLEIETAPRYKAIIYVLCFAIAVQPLLFITTYINEQLVLPNNLVDIEGWMREKEIIAKALIEQLISNKSFFSYLSNVFIIGILAGVGEELLFRGCLQKIWIKIVKNKHVAVLITAFIFSAIHFQFYGFMPRFIAGVLLGYLFVYTNNLWYPIIAHIVHNSTTILIAQTTYNTSHYNYIENLSIVNYIILALISIPFLAVLIFLVRKNKVFLKIR